jgi:hypothetical protein
MHAGFWLGDLREREHLEGLGLDGMMPLKWSFSKWWTGLGLPQNKGKRLVVKTAMNIRFPWNVRNFLT